MQYVTEVKLRTAKELIMSNKATLADAGRLVGIEDANYLSRLIKKHYASSMRQMMKSTDDIDS
jgi:AraC-like DNA-binding protein